MQAQKECELELERLDRVIAESKAQRDKFMCEYNEMKKAQPPAYEPLPELKTDDFVCPTCGQILPEEKKEELLMRVSREKKIMLTSMRSPNGSLNQYKKEKIAYINERGSECCSQKSRNAKPIKLR